MIRAVMTASILLAVAFATPAAAGPAWDSAIEAARKTTEERYIVRDGAEIWRDRGENLLDQGRRGGTVEIVPALSDEEYTMIVTCDGVAWMRSADLLPEEPAPQVKLRSMGVFKLTYYDPHPCCGTGNGITASGRRAEVGRTIAISKKYAPLGAHVMINGHEYVVDDRGVTGRTVDILVSTHQEAKKKGVDYAEVFSIEH